ncbi:MAG: phospholipase [Flavobacteriales bacterium]|nr:phospholipase [Flavobacteriales bacterium]
MKFNMEQSKVSFVEVPRTARYFRMNSVQKMTKNVWVVFHGYGQSAEYFIKHFRDLDPSENFIIALEGLSKFYVEGLTGRVGASWMTKQDRELEIKDQSNYINAVLKDCGVDVKNMNQRLIVLGFSQGTATAVRWLANNNIRPNELILWAGSFPHDVDATEHEDVFKKLNMHFAYGNKDQFLEHINVEERVAEFEKMGMKLKVWSFEGKHVMDKPTLAKIVGSF